MTFEKQKFEYQMEIMEMLHFLVVIVVLWFCLGKKKESLPFRDNY